jgi:hypothetical protein
MDSSAQYSQLLTDEALSKLAGLAKDWEERQGRKAFTGAPAASAKPLKETVPALGRDPAVELFDQQGNLPGAYHVPQPPNALAGAGPLAGAPYNTIGAINVIPEQPVIDMSTYSLTVSVVPRGEKSLLDSGDANLRSAAKDLRDEGSPTGNISSLLGQQIAGSNVASLHGIIGEAVVAYNLTVQGGVASQHPRQAYRSASTHIQDAARVLGQDPRWRPVYIPDDMPHDIVETMASLWVESGPSGYNWTIPAVQFGPAGAAQRLPVMPAGARLSYPGPRMTDILFVFSTRRRAQAALALGGHTLTMPRLGRYLHWWRAQRNAGTVLRDAEMMAAAACHVYFNPVEGVQDGLGPGFTQIEVREAKTLPLRAIGQNERVDGYPEVGPADFADIPPAGDWLVHDTSYIERGAHAFLDATRAMLPQLAVPLGVPLQYRDCGPVAAGLRFAWGGPAAGIQDVDWALIAGLDAMNPAQVGRPATAALRLAYREYQLTLLGEHGHWRLQAAPVHDWGVSAVRYQPGVVHDDQGRSAPVVRNVYGQVEGPDSSAVMQWPGWQPDGWLAVLGGILVPSLVKAAPYIEYGNPRREAAARLRAARLHWLFHHSLYTRGVSPDSVRAHPLAGALAMQWIPELHRSACLPDSTSALTMPYTALECLESGTVFDNVKPRTPFIDYSTGDTWAVNAGLPTVLREHAEIQAIDGAARASIQYGGTLALSGMPMGAIARIRVPVGVGGIVCPFFLPDSIWTGGFAPVYTAVQNNSGQFFLQNGGRGFLPTLQTA